MAINMQAIKHIRDVTQTKMLINSAVEHYAKGYCAPGEMWYWLNVHLSAKGTDFVLEALTDSSKETIRECIQERETSFLSCVQQAPIMAIFRVI